MANEIATTDRDECSTTPEYAVTDGDHYYGPYKSEDRAYRRKARWNDQTDRDFIVVDVNALEEDVEYER